MGNLQENGEFIKQPKYTWVSPCVLYVLYMHQINVYQENSTDFHCHLGKFSEVSQNTGLAMVSRNSVFEKTMNQCNYTGGQIL